MGDFQKRHYEAIAAVIKEATPTASTINAYDRSLMEETRYEIAALLVALFTRDSREFDADRFLAAAGVSLYD